MKTLFKLGVLMPVLLWSLVLPKISAVLLDLHPSFQVAVICTGTQLVTLRLGPDGQPVEVDAGQDGPCVLGDTAAVDFAQSSGWMVLAASFHAPFVVHTNRQDKFDPEGLRREGQGPPVA